MARSSGGGSRSGGSRSSRSSSSRSSHSSNSYRTSHTPFYGARRFAYYRNGRPNYVYANYDIRKAYDGPRWFFILFYIPFFIAVFAMASASLTFPRDPLQSYHTHETCIVDDADVFTSQEENTLQITLMDFTQTTGVPVQIQTVETPNWDKAFNSISEYGLMKYYQTFSHEDGWLITVSVQNDYYGNLDWNWEGTQGDNTIKVLDVFVERFNYDLQHRLYASNQYSVAEALDITFKESTYAFQNQKLRINGEFLPMLFFMVPFLLIHAYFMVFAGTKKDYKNSELVEVTDSEPIQSPMSNHAKQGQSIHINSKTPAYRVPEPYSKVETNCSESAQSMLGSYSKTKANSVNSTLETQIHNKHFDGFNSTTMSYPVMRSGMCEKCGSAFTNNTTGRCPNCNAKLPRERNFIDF